jgi:hypothetical protein
VRAKLSIGPEGQVAVPPRQARSLGLASGEAVEVAAAPGSFLLVTPARKAGGGQHYFAGSLASLTVVEVMQFIFTSLKSGVLELRFGEAGERSAAAGPEAPSPRRRALYFRDGQLVFASSTDPCDRLGPVLWRQELLTWAQLEQCAPAVQAGRPLGQALVELGILSPAQAYAGVVQQVKEILLSAFLEGEGEFLFLEGPLQESNAVRLQERTRDLVLVDLKLVEEADRLLGEVGGREVILTRTVEPTEDLGEQAARLLLAFDGRRSFDAAARESALGLLEALRHAAPLLAAGMLVPAGAAPPPPPPAEPALSPVPGTLPALGTPSRVGGPFESYRRIFRRVHQALAAVEPSVLERLNGYFERLGPKARPIFEGVRFQTDGELEVARVLANVQAAGAYRGAAAKARSLEALEALLAFALFEVKSLLPKAEAEALLREVGRMQVGKA